MLLDKSAESKRAQRWPNYSERAVRGSNSAVSSIADEERMVQLGRIARTEPALSHAALNAPGDIDQPRANAIATAVRNALQPRSAVAPQNGSDRMRRDTAATLDPPQMTHMQPWGESYWIASSEAASSGSGIVRPSN